MQKLFKVFFAAQAGFEPYVSTGSGSVLESESEAVHKTIRPLDDWAISISKELVSNVYANVKQKF